MEQETRTMWITRYALTKGVFSTRVEAERGAGHTESWSKGHRVYRRKPGYVSEMYRVEFDAFFTEKEANEAASRMRDKKIASLKKQIAKLEKMTF